MPYFVYKLIPPRPTFDQDMDERERAIMSQHVAYYAKLHQQGRVIVYGPVRDSTGSWGLGVIEAEELDDVKAIAERDPAASSGTCSYDLGVLVQAMLHPSLSAAPIRQQVLAAATPAGDDQRGGTNDAP
jgi:uncharacterized protein YciI